MNKTLKKAFRKVLAESFRVARPIERFLSHNEDTDIDGVGPVFIVGAPRCGSTLLFQVLTSIFDFSYFTNFSSLFYHSPRVGFYLEKRVRRQRNKDWQLSSQYGMTTGFWGPHECGKFWRQWFPDDRDFVDESDYSEERFFSLVDTVSGIYRATRKPLIIKNLNCGQRLRVIKRCFPHALVIFCRRAPFFTAQSILMARRRNNEDLNAWWSVRPKNFRELEKLPFMDQIAHQVIAIERQIEIDLMDFEENRICSVPYEQFCSNTNAELSRLEEWLRVNEITVKREQTAVPNLTASNSVNINQEETEMLKVALEKAKMEYRQWT